MSDKSTHGGKRQNAGRKREFEKLERHTVTLLPEHVEWLTKLGDGKLSAGIRILVEEHIDK